MWLEKIILTKEDNLHYIIIYYSQSIRVRKRDEGRYLEKLIENALIPINPMNPKTTVCRWNAYLSKNREEEKFPRIHSEQINRNNNRGTAAALNLAVFFVDEKEE